jgi:hypothetical protein
MLSGFHSSELCFHSIFRCPLPFQFVLFSIVLNGALHCVSQTTATGADVERQVTNTGSSIRRLKVTVTPRDASGVPEG